MICVSGFMGSQNSESTNGGSFSGVFVVKGVFIARSRVIHHRRHHHDDGHKHLVAFGWVSPA